MKATVRPGKAGAGADAPGETRCPLCQSPPERVVIREHGYAGVRCEHCGLIYIAPRPSWETIAGCYEAAGDGGAAPALVSDSRWQRWARRLPARHTLDLLQDYRTSGSLLELGPGYGDFLAAAAARGFAVTGLEINRQRAGQIQKGLGLPCVSLPLEDPCWQGRRFDIVYHRDVLSHFYDPVAEFRLIHGILQDKGLLVFETGNLGEVADRYLGEVPTFDYPEHLYFFGEKSLRRLLAATGFEPLTLRRYGLGVYFKVERWVQAWRRQRQRAKAAAPSVGTEGGQTGRPGGWRDPLKQFLLGSYAIGVEYLLKYQLGGLLAKAGRPQTLLVIARKVGTGGGRAT